MPRILTGAGILVALLSPVFALAAYNDVSLTTDTVLSVNGITLNVSGSTAAVESIVVNATNFSVTLQSGSSFQVTATGLERMSASTLTGISSDICSASQSLLKYAPSTEVTVTITPSATLCSSTSSGSETSTTISTGPTTPAVTTTPATTTTTPAVTTPVTTTPAVTTSTTETVTTTTTNAVSASGLSASQITSILDVLASFDADAATIAKVRASLEGTVTGSVTSAAVHAFKANLTLGSLGEEVKALQQYLNAHGYTVSATGAGSVGNETTKFGGLTKAALIKFQKAKGITPAVGYFGAKTRAAIEANP